MLQRTRRDILEASRKVCKGMTPGGEYAGLGMITLEMDMVTVICDWQLILLELVE